MGICANSQDAPSSGDKQKDKLISKYIKVGDECRRLDVGEGMDPAGKARTRMQLMDVSVGELEERIKHMEKALPALRKAQKEAQKEAKKYG